MEMSACQLTGSYIRLSNNPMLFFFFRRRFFPVKLIYNILDGMSYNKLNVLHWHLSDFCRFSVESKL